MIETKHLFPILDEKLIQLLKSLDETDWDKSTVARLWTVRDVAAHLLDGNIRMLSFSRDGHSSAADREINSYADLIDYLNQLNADWVIACKRMSRAVLTDMLRNTGRQFSDHVQTLNPESEALFSVAWAGETSSKNWFHIAREYTEKWHHQQQIRKATGRPGIMNQELFYPFIDTLMLGLPHTYRHVSAKTDTVLQINIELEQMPQVGTWYLVKKDNGWAIEKQNTYEAQAAITMNAEISWQLFTKAIKAFQVREQIKITGDENLAATALTMIAVMA